MSEIAFPALNSFTKSLDMISTKITEQLRQNFIKRVDKNPELYYEEDVERVKTNDWTVRRFLYNYKTNPDLNRGLEALDKAMKWRKSFAVLDLSEEHFPQELYVSAGALIYGKDLNGSPLLILRGKVAIRIKPWLNTYLKFLVYLIEAFDSKEQNNKLGLTILMDFRDTSVQNADIDYLKFLYTLFNEYYPGLVNASLIYKLPIVLETIYKLFRSWLLEEQTKYVQLISKRNINQFVALDELPNFLMGTNIQSYRTVPEKAPSAHELADRLDIKMEKTDKLVKHLQKFYKN